MIHRILYNDIATIDVIYRLYIYCNKNFFIINIILFINDQKSSLYNNK